MIVRDEAPADASNVRRLLESAFGGPAEARLVERLRGDGDVMLALVAEREGRIAGHILFSRLQAPCRALALAPLAVAPDAQGEGIGSALVRTGLDRAKASGWDAVFVLGDPNYYARFGFSTDAAENFRCPYSGPHFMALSLGPGHRSSAGGTLAYPRAFAEL